MRLAEMKLNQTPRNNSDREILSALAIFGDVDQCNISLCAVSAHSQTLSESLER